MFVALAMLPLCAGCSFYDRMKAGERVSPIMGRSVEKNGGGYDIDYKKLRDPSAFANGVKQALVIL